MAETETRPRRDVGTSRDRDVETETTTLVIETYSPNFLNFGLEVP